jgi:hypothetical protein
VKRGAFVRRFSFLAGVVGLLLCALTARPAHAQFATAGTTGTTTATTGTLATTDFFIGVQAVEGSNLTNFQLLTFFDRANCLCNKDVFLYYTLTESGISKRSTTPAGTVSFWVGSSCGDPILQREECQFIGSDQITTFMNLGRETIKTNTQVISSNSTLDTGTVDGGILTGGAGTAPNTTCASDVNGFDQTVWAVFDYGSDGVLDLAVSQAVHVDLTPPPAPANIKVRSGNEAVVVSWTPVDASLTTDLQGYQVLCQRAANLQVFSSGAFASYVETCPTTLTSTDDLTSLDPKFVCSPLLTATASSYRVKILQNGIYYAATVVAIDTAGNASPATLVGPDKNGGSYEIPALTESFYDVYRDGNSTNGGPPGQTTATPGLATGGFCAIGDGARGRTSFGVGLGASVLVAAALARRRRRR